MSFLPGLSNFALGWIFLASAFVLWNCKNYGHHKYGKMSVACYMWRIWADFLFLAGCQKIIHFGVAFNLGTNSV